MDKINGNYLTQPNRDFPLDCETLDYIQQQIDLALSLGLQLGDRLILSGCTVSGTTRGEGYVYVTTEAAPTGEVLRFEGGSESLGCHVKEESVGVSANGYDYPQAYTRRTLVAGLGGEHFSWSEFRTLPTLGALRDEVESLRRQHQRDMAALTPNPLGFVELWSGGADSVPEGWALCDGRELSVADYPELYGVIGTTYNTAPSQSGERYATTSGKFRLPDLRGRFVAGYSDTDTDYRTAVAGGRKSNVLTEGQTPQHKHLTKDIVNLPNGNGEIVTGTVTVGTENCPAGGLNVSGLRKRAQTDSFKGVAQYIEHSTEDAGYQYPDPVENRPPYYTLAYVMRLR